MELVLNKVKNKFSSFLSSVFSKIIVFLKKLYEYISFGIKVVTLPIYFLMWILYIPLKIIYKYIDKDKKIIFNIIFLSLILSIYHLFISPEILFNFIDNKLNIININLFFLDLKYNFINLKMYIYYGITFNIIFLIIDSGFVKFNRGYALKKIAINPVTTTKQFLSLTVVNTINIFDILQKGMKKLFKNHTSSLIFYFFSLIIKIITFPLYIIVWLHYKFIESLFKQIKAKFVKDYIVERIDMYFLRVGVVLCTIYIIFIINYMSNFLSNILQSFNLRINYNVLLSTLNIIGEFSNILIYIISFVIIDEIFFKKLNLADVDYAPYHFIKNILRRFATANNKIFAGVAKNDKKRQTPFKKPVIVTEKMREGHTAGIGTTGSGKSKSYFFPWIIQDLQAHKGAFIINAKGDYDFAEEIYTYWKNNIDTDQDFKFVNLADIDYSNTYNPILRGTAMEIRDRIVGAIDWSEIYYKSKSKDVLRFVLKAIEELNKKVTIMDLYNLISDKKAINEMKYELENEQLKRAITQSIYKNDDYDKEVSGLKSALGDLARGAFGSIINTYQPDVDLLESYKNNDIVFFNIPATLIGESAREFGKMLLMDLKTLSGEIERGQAEKKFFPVYIDEFAELVMDEFIGFMNKARSAGLKIHLAYQSIGDLENLSDNFVKQVIDNTNLNLVFRNNEDTSAEKFAKLLGTKKSLKETARVEKSLISQSESDMGSLRETDEFYISPNEIRQLKQGQAIIFGKSPEFFYDRIYTDFINDDFEPNQIEIKNYNINNNNNEFLNAYDNYCSNTTNTNNKTKNDDKKKKKYKISRYDNLLNYKIYYKKKKNDNIKDNDSVNKKSNDNNSTLSNKY